jgi:hypothetical protein
MQLTAVPLHAKQWPATIAQVFKRDALLLRYYHVKAPCVLSLAVADTYRCLQLYTDDDFVLYALLEPGHSTPVGMVGVEPSSNMLVTFGLNIACRTPEGVAALAQSVRQLLNLTQPVRAILYSKNKPAIQFLKRMGFKEEGGPLEHPENGQMGQMLILEPL